MKPHEEEWGFTHASGEWISRDGGGGPIIFTAHGSEEAIKVRSALACAAPEMARMLLDFFKNYEIGPLADERMVALLTKAGVLP